MIKQLAICEKFGAEYLECPDFLKVGISRNFDPRVHPINGLIHAADGETTGWYIWTGEKFPDASDFFLPPPVAHFVARCPEIIKYLGLAPGWRFLFTPDYEDVWYDGDLLKIVSDRRA